MCIRDRVTPVAASLLKQPVSQTVAAQQNAFFDADATGSGTCLLYTSDAADERSSVDLGGRRIIKKKQIGALRRVDVTIQ